jgi:hypothetical protein
MSDMMAHLHSLTDGVRHMSYGDPDDDECVQASDVVQWAIDEIERLRLAIRRLAEQDATLSLLCKRDGSQVVTVTMDATLTDAEREAIKDAISCCEDITYGGAADQEAADVLNALLERTK